MEPMLQTINYAMGIPLSVMEGSTMPSGAGTETGAPAVTRPAKSPGSDRLLAALVLGGLALVLALASLSYVLLVNPGQPKAIPSNTVYSQTVAATVGSASGGYFGFANFTVPGPVGALVVVTLAAVPGVNGCGTYPINICEVVLINPTSSLTSYSEYSGLVLNASLPGPFWIEATVPTGSLEVVTESLPSYGATAVNAEAYSVTVSVTSHGALQTK